jgi:hypothetical protein
MTGSMQQTSAAENSGLLPQVVKKNFGTQRFATVVTTARHFSLSVSQINPFHALPSHLFNIHFNIYSCL